MAASIELRSRKLKGELPPLLKAASRSAGAPADDPFLPPGYVEARAVYDVAATRGDAGAAAQSLAPHDDEVLVIELADRGTLVTTAAQLHAALERSHPELIVDGVVQFDRLVDAGSASRGVFDGLAGALVSRVFTIGVGALGDDPVLEDAKERLGVRAAELGVTWAGTKALMWAIEKRLLAEPGTLARWVGARGSEAALEPVDAAALERAQRGDGDARKPMLVFIHGTASNTLGSFGDLHAGERDVWTALERRYEGGIYAFEHRTLSESPIDNAIALAEALPRGAHVSLVTHSRGGLVGDLLCLAEFDAHIDHYRADVPGAVAAPDAEDVHEEQRAQLRRLAALLRERKLVIQRYVRVASPARGTKLASGNFDVFLSGLLTLIGQVPFFFGQPAYMAFKRVVLEIVRKRTDPHLVPGIEAMLPDAPMARLLRESPVQPGLEMAVIAGDIEGGGLLQRLGVFLTDFLLYDQVENDLVVDTAAMLAGVAPHAGAKVLFDQGAEVTHFRYFANLESRFALRDWLVAGDVGRLDAFQPIPLPGDDAGVDVPRLSRGADVAALPVAVILPGVMGSHLWVNRRDRVWLDPVDVAAGGLEKIAWEQQGVEAEKLFSMFYGDLAEHLAGSHRVERFAYDWRQPLDVLGERLGEYLANLLQQTKQPIRLLAHSMGGLVVRACIHRRRAVMDELMARDGARFVMLGTPNQGAHSMVENLLGKGDTLRSLVRLDLRHDMAEVLKIVSGFRGALQLLPKPGFVDDFQGSDDGGIVAAYGEAQTWAGFRQQVFDFWFGDHQSATPTQRELDEASWLWKQDGSATPALPDAYEPKTVYVHGVAPNTPCGVRPDARGRLKMVGTPRGDGTVTWVSGAIGRIGRRYYLPAAHGALLSTKEHFPAIADLLASGATAKLATTPPATRAIEQPRPVSYDAGPPTIDDGAALAFGLVGGTQRTRLAARSTRRLEVAVKAMDLRYARVPILVGTYEHDPIAGPQKLIDTELLGGDLSERYNLGLYAGPRGTATAVLRAPNEQERRRGSLSGAVVTGLGSYEKALSTGDLTEAVRTGVLRYLLQVVDVLGKREGELPLATLLLGYNSSANLTVADSVEALVRGVLEGNARFFETTRVNLRVSSLTILEIYLDTAITAAHSLRRLGPKLAAMAKAQRATLVCSGELGQGEGWRQRLYDRASSSYWPRLVVTDADRRDDAPADRPVVIADRLRFLYVGQRARAESVVQQRQPGLIEALVRQQIATTSWNPDIGRMLFQLMVPSDFKDAARQLDRVVLVVDRTTANLPWELMCAGDPAQGNDTTPLAVRTPVVRQLESSQYRRVVRQSVERSALVVGNPSLSGFAKAFALADELPPLAGAEQEAESVGALLSSLDYAVEREIGEDRAASDVLAALYRRPYRIVHISAHGVFDLAHPDGRRRSGVVLSDGLLITAAEIDAMEVVPELVFLSCCHLGKVDVTVRDANKLAASVARELIGIGVRCVVAAGWAVDDASAQLLGETFYRTLLLDRQPFGLAVLAARRAVWEQRPGDITWGAFQAYGDPGWRAEVARDGGGPAPADYASVEEALDELASLRSAVSRRPARLTERERAAQVRAVNELCRQVPPSMLDLPELKSALARTWAALGRLEDARRYYLQAVQAEDKRGVVPIRDLEQLASVEIKLGSAERVEGALARLDELDRLVGDRPLTPAGAAADTGPPGALPAHAERSALRGSAWKRLANLQAQALLAKDVTPTAAHTAGQKLREALENSAAAYRHAEGSPGQPQFRPYLALNRLALDAVVAPGDDAALALAQQAGAAASEAFRREGDYYSAVMAPEALLVERLLDRRLGLPGEAGDAALAEVVHAYHEALSNVTRNPKEIETSVDQLCLLSRFFDAMAVAEGAADATRIAGRLIALGEQLLPGACRRADRPGAPPASAPAPRKAAAKKAAAKKAAARRKR